MRLSVLVSIVLAALALVVAACGSGASEQADDSGSQSSGGGIPTTNEDGKRGGLLTMLASGDVDYLDPGKAYYQFSYMLLQNATQRPLYAYKPGETETPTPDIAASDPQISEDGKTVTVKLKRGIRYSPPVDREVKAADVKYAIE